MYTLFINLCIRCLLVVIISCFGNLSFGQYDTAKLDIGFKTAIYLNSIHIRGSSIDSFAKFIQVPLIISEINSSGFSNSIRFFKIDNLKQQLGSSKTLFLTDCPIPFIIGFNTLDNSIFRVKGFDKTDIEALFTGKKLKLKLSNTYEIEGVDLLCLIKGTLKKKPTFKEFPCLRGCGESQGFIH